MRRVEHDGRKRGGGNGPQKFGQQHAKRGGGPQNRGGFQARRNSTVEVDSPKPVTPKVEVKVKTLGEILEEKQSSSSKPLQAVPAAEPSAHSPQQAMPMEVVSQHDQTIIAPSTDATR